LLRGGSDAEISLNNPQCWRDNAAEMRALAEGMKDAASRVYRAESRAVQPDRIAINVAKMTER
jgi:hypothetical protein